MQTKKKKFVSLRVKV